MICIYIHAWSNAWYVNTIAYVRMISKQASIKIRSISSTPKDLLLRKVMISARGRFHSHGPFWGSTLTG